MKSTFLTLAIIFLVSVLFVNATVSISTRQAGEYDPWVDIDDDGDIDIFDIVKIAGMYDTYGEPFVAKAAIESDSGWIDITDKAGQYFNITHNLNSSDILVDIQGRTTYGGGVHQRYLGGTGCTLGWNRSYGGNASDGGRAVVQTSDGGYVIAGDTVSYAIGPYSAEDFWLVKIDSTGYMQWNRTYGGLTIDRPYSVVETSDGGYAIAGETWSYGAGEGDFWLVKTDPLGNMQWNQTYGYEKQELAFSVVQTNDGGYAMAGYTTSRGKGSYDFWLVKTNSTGHHQWNQTYGETYKDQAYSVVQ